MEHWASHLDDDEQTDPSAHLGRVPVHARHDIHNGLANGDDHAKYWQERGRENTLTAKGKERLENTFTTKFSHLGKIL